MATLGTINSAVVNDTKYAGDRVQVFPFTAISDTNTWASGITGITRVAFSQPSSTDYVAVMESGGTITVGTDGVTTYAGNLLVWSKRF